MKLHVHIENVSHYSFSSHIVLHLGCLLFVCVCVYIYESASFIFLYPLIPEVEILNLCVMFVYATYFQEPRVWKKLFYSNYGTWGINGLIPAIVTVLKAEYFGWVAKLWPDFDYVHRTVWELSTLSIWRTCKFKLRLSLATF